MQFIRFTAGQGVGEIACCRKNGIASEIFQELCTLSKALCRHFDNSVHLTLYKIFKNVTD